MIQRGQVVLFPFPHTNQTKSKLRPALVIEKNPGRYDDWLICMISSQLHHEVKDFDEILWEADSDFPQSGLKTTSLIRLGRLAVVDRQILVGTIGQVGSERLIRIKDRIAGWIKGT